MNKLLRIITILVAKNGLLIKGINFEGLRVLGDDKDSANLYFSEIVKYYNINKSYFVKLCDKFKLPNLWKKIV